MTLGEKNPSKPGFYLPQRKREVEITASLAKLEKYPGLNQD